jgi:hypothetical protein
MLNHNNNNNKESEFFEPLDIETGQVIHLPKPHINVCVLKHLARPLEIMDKDDAYLNFADPVCSFPVKLHSLPDRLLPTQ